MAASQDSSGSKLLHAANIILAQKHDPDVRVTVISDMAAYVRSLWMLPDMAMFPHHLEATRLTCSLKQEPIT